jgi:hypothetical protein
VLSTSNTAVSSLELIGENPGLKTLNELLKNELRVGLSEYLNCPSNARDNDEKNIDAQTRDYSFSIKPNFWNGQWISLQTDIYGDCGGAAPFSSFAYTTWDLNAGKKVNLWHWLKHLKRPNKNYADEDYYFYYAATVRLNALITKRAIQQRLAWSPKEASEENNCIAVIRENREYDLRLSKKGIIFTQHFPWYTFACTDNIELSFSELMPFLNKEGKSAVMQN